MLSSPGRKENHLITVGIISILLYLFIFPLFFSPIFLQLFGIPEINGTLLFISRLLYWIGLALVWLYSVKVEKQNILIWEDRRYKFLLYVVSIISIFIVLNVGLALIRNLYSQTHFSQTSDKMTGLANIFRQNESLLVFTALTAGITEEVIFRGYLQPRLQIIFRSPFLGILISSVLFGLLHYGYGTAFNVIAPFFIGFVFAFYYWQFRNIKVLIICHSLWDLLALYSLLKHHH
jgi:uncharacterized protein